MNCRNKPRGVSGLDAGDLLQDYHRLVSNLTTVRTAGWITLSISSFYHLQNFSKIQHHYFGADGYAYYSKVFDMALYKSYFIYSVRQNISINGFNFEQNSHIIRPVVVPSQDMNGIQQCFTYDPPGPSEYGSVAGDMV